MHEEDVSSTLCAHLLGKLERKLTELLTSFRADEWDLQTIAPQWKVRDAETFR
jgi:hypothetical protein